MEPNKLEVYENEQTKLLATRANPHFDFEIYLDHF